MKSRASIIDYILLGLLIANFLLPFGSWMLSAFGFPCNSLFSDEGWRWLFLHSSDVILNRWTLLCLGVIIMVGAVEKSGLLSVNFRRDRHAVCCALLTALFFLLTFVVAALYQQSPLIGITGRLYPSPLLHGLPAAGVIAVVATSVVFGLCSDRISSASALSSLFTHGMRRYADFLFVSILLSLLYNCFTYIF